MILQFPHPALLKKAQDMPPEDILAETTRDMVHLMRKYCAAGYGIGLAAPQIGWDRACILVMGRICFNPKVLRGYDPIKSIEGCLSISGKRFEVERLNTIRVNYLDEEGKSVDTAFMGTAACVFQHEASHLLGITLANDPKAVEIGWA